jgi:hypothetical protein
MAVADPSAKNPIVPLPSEGVTVAVKVTAWVPTVGLSDEATVVALTAWSMVSPPLSVPVLAWCTPSPV